MSVYLRFSAGNASNETKMSCGERERAWQTEERNEMKKKVKMKTGGVGFSDWLDRWSDLPEDVMVQARCLRAFCRREGLRVPHLCPRPVRRNSAGVDS